MDAPLSPVSRSRIDAFVRRHFGVLGSVRLHRLAVGLDLLRAPANVFLSPLLVICRLLAWVLGKLGLRKAARWLGTRRLLMRTTVAARIEADILRDLLGIPLPEHAGGPSREALKQAILSAPHLRNSIGQRATPAAAEAMADRILGALAEYSGTRSAIAEFTTALVMLAVGALVFHSLTPGAISMAPGLAEQVARNSAIADFPLGAWAGGMWYGLFPSGPSHRLVTLTVIALMLAGTVVTTFAGLIADPIQSAMGMHQRRLTRLIDTIEAEIAELPERPFVAREHFLARVFDLWDAAMSLLKVFRG
ncbi:hypothetical protein HJ526_16075 [Donghicola sp. C2-DW-16]|uniref:Uncharacterized protein n=1 Tax=Donghicola mangrovi TaxID=2729614 RepID=A0ABX2PIQ5_9RHOB|nr:DUF6635 family protein [Donghicola mangrovi]NVO28949.1 hypothetical protein [Donghicola mangrovi]